MIPKPGEDPKSKATVRQITDEDICYSTIIESHPALEGLVDKFDLCSVKTGNRFIKTVKRETVRPQQAPVSENYSWLMYIAAQSLSAEVNYKKDEIIEAVQKRTKRSKKGSADIFELMVDAGVLTDGSLAGHFCFNHSTPF